MQDTRVQSPGGEDLVEKEMANHSNIFAGEIPWTEELGGLQSMRLPRVGYDLATEQLQVVLETCFYKPGFIM